MPIILHLGFFLRPFMWNLSAYRPTDIDPGGVEF